MTVSVFMLLIHVFRCYMSCSCYRWGSPKPRSFPGVYLSIYGGFLLANNLGKNNMYRADVISSPSAFEQLVVGRV